MSVNDAAGSVNSRSRLMTGMPASIADLPTDVSWAPSWGRSTIASGLLWMSDCSAAIWAGASFPASTALRVTSENLAAWAFALAVMAPIQPWSAAGAEKPIVTALPGASLLEPVLTCAPLSPLLLVSLDVQPARIALPARAAPPNSRWRRDALMRMTSIKVYEAKPPSAVDGRVGTIGRAIG